MNFDPPSPADTRASAVRGVMVPENGAFAVTSRHTRVVNLLARDEFGPYLVSLIADPSDWTELSILLSADLWRREASREVGESSPITTLGSVLAPTPVREASASLPTTATLNACRAALLQDYFDVGFVSLLSEAPLTDPFVARAADALRTSKPWRPGTTARLAKLIGLGPGFTPAGDDFLSGVVLAELMTSGAPPSRPTVTAIQTRLSATTAGGAALLRLAIAGYPPRYQDLASRALVADDVDGAIGIAARHGHSSGLDFLTGLLWALGD